MTLPPSNVSLAEWSIPSEENGSDEVDERALYAGGRPSGAKGWIFRYQLRGKRREMGLGTLEDVTAPEALAEAPKRRRTLLSGVDPIEERTRLAELTAMAAQAALLMP